MTRLLLLLLLFPLLIMTSCKGSQKAGASKQDDGIIEVIVLHINDVYEIGPLEGGRVGGMARISTLKYMLEAENPNVLLVHAGDFLSPSLLGTFRYQGQRINGRHMVEVMNALEVDLVTFGNHEFDIDEEALQARLNESNFTWLGTNVRHRTGPEDTEPFYSEKFAQRVYMPDTYIWNVKDADGTSARIGFFGSTIPSNPRDYVVYEDIFDKPLYVYPALAKRTDVVLGLTHLELEQDKELARRMPKVPLLMGGHDHDNSLDTIGSTLIAKADANAKTVYVHRLRIDKRKGETSVHSTLVNLDEKIPFEPEVEAVVNKWLAIQDETIGQTIDNPNEVLMTATVPLDGRERSVRNFQTNLGGLICRSLSASATSPVDGSMINSGGIRLDDQLEGDITAVDFFRAMPFGGAIYEADIDGDLLKIVLDVGMRNKGTGGYLQLDKIEFREMDNSWWVNGTPLDVNKTYRIALNDFLISGREIRLDFFTENHQGVRAVYKPTENDKNDPRNDIRSAITAYLKGGGR